MLNSMIDSALERQGFVSFMEERLEIPPPEAFMPPRTISKLLSSFTLNIDKLFLKEVHTNKWLALHSQFFDGHVYVNLKTQWFATAGKTNILYPYSTDSWFSLLDLVNNTLWTRYYIRQAMAGYSMCVICNSSSHIQPCKDFICSAGASAQTK